MTPTRRSAVLREQLLLAGLARWEQELRSQIAERRESLERPMPASETPGDEGDLADARTRAGIDRDLIDRYLIELEEIEQARGRIAEGSFGICPDCGDLIGWERIRANPVARRCTDCQALHERRHPGALRALTR